MHPRRPCICTRVIKAIAGESRSSAVRPRDYVQDESPDNPLLDSLAWIASDNFESWRGRSVRFLQVGIRET